MTKNQIEAARVSETARSNRENERISEKKAVLDAEAKKYAADVKNPIGAFARGRTNGLHHSGGELFSRAVKDIGSVNRAARDQFRRQTRYAQKGADNDPSWYFKDPQLAADVASFSFNKIYGAAVSADETEGILSTTAPLVMALPYVPAIGDLSSLKSSPAYVQAVNLYSFIRHANAGSANGTPEDTLIQLAATCEAYSAVIFGQRAYGLINHYRKLNLAVPRVFFKAMHLNYDDWYLHQTQLRNGLNTIIRKLDSLVIPAGITLFQRRLWMNSKIFMDKELNRTQMYMFVPEGFYQYAPKSSASNETAYSNLKYVKFTEYIDEYADNSSDLTVSEFLDFINNILLEPMFGDEDLGILKGDILKAFPGDLFHIDLIHEEFEVEPEFSVEVLTQIQNATLLQGNTAHMDWGLIQTGSGGFKYALCDKGNWSSATLTKTSRPNLWVTENIPILRRCITMPMDHPTPSDVIVATRLSATTTRRTGSVSSAGYVEVRCGTEYIVEARVYMLSAHYSGTLAKAAAYAAGLVDSWDSAIVAVPVSLYELNSYIKSQDGDVLYDTNPMVYWGQLRCFDYAPKMCLIQSVTVASSTVYIPVFSLNVVDNYQVITSEQLSAIDTVCVLGELSVPDTPTARIR